MPKELKGVPNIYTLRGQKDVYAIDDALKVKMDHVTVVGAGFIGLEMVENLKYRGVKKVFVFFLHYCTLTLTLLECIRWSSSRRRTKS